MFFFFKQKTAYELRISDWSSDVCSSDLSSYSVTPAIHGSGSAENPAILLWQSSHALITSQHHVRALNDGMSTQNGNFEERAREGGPVRVAMVGAGALARVIEIGRAHV